MGNTAADGSSVSLGTDVLDSGLGLKEMVHKEEVQRTRSSSSQFLKSELNMVLILPQRARTNPLRKLTRLGANGP